MSWTLKRTVQCAKCPWKVGINPYDIPNGYSLEQHHGLRGTIASPGEINLSPSPVMACHETHDAHCVGWLHNQLGVGNNIGLRLQMRNCVNAARIQVVGPQHPDFESTLPKD